MTLRMQNYFKDGYFLKKDIFLRKENDWTISLVLTTFEGYEGGDQYGGEKVVKTFSKKELLDL